MSASTKKETKSPKSTKWEDSNLNNLKDGVAKTISFEKNVIKTGGGTHLKTGEKIPVSHYEKNLSYDKQALNRVQNEIKKRKLIKSLKEKNDRIAKDTKVRKRDIVDDYLEE